MDRRNKFPAIGSHIKGTTYHTVRVHICIIRLDWALNALACDSPQIYRQKRGEQSAANAVVDELASGSRTCWIDSVSKLFNDGDVASYLKFACHICRNKGVRRSKNCVFSKSSAESVFSGWKSSVASQSAGHIVNAFSGNGKASTHRH